MRESRTQGIPTRLQHCVCSTMLPLSHCLHRSPGPQASHLFSLGCLDVRLIIEVDEQRENGHSVEDESVLHPANEPASEVERLPRVTHPYDKLRLQRHHVTHLSLTWGTHGTREFCPLIRADMI